MDITERKTGQYNLHKLNRAFKAVSKCIETLVHAENEQQLFADTCKVVTDVGGYSLAWIGIKNADQDKTVCLAAHSGRCGSYMSDLNITWADNEHGRGPTGTAIRTGKRQVVQDLQAALNYAPWKRAVSEFGFASALALPLLDRAGNSLGALTILAHEIDAFNDEEVLLLTELASDLSFGIVSLRMRSERDLALKESQAYQRKLGKSLEDALEALAAMTELRDPYTAGHQRRVGELASSIARNMGLPTEQVHAIHLAGVVHDVGKIHIPSEILSKPGKLTPLEFEMLKTHAQAGYDILKSVDFPWPIAEMVLQHHERIDGSGYPHGLKGEEILLEAKIIAVADVVEAMSSHRPYRAALGIDMALDEITKNRDVLYDPQAVDTCVSLFRDEQFKFTLTTPFQRQEQLPEPEALPMMSPRVPVLSLCANRDSYVNVIQKK
jgi:HD-GYP domain-containing protein (c-di-GMP phosphodiesterase class II)